LRQLVWRTIAPRAETGQQPGKHSLGEQAIEGRVFLECDEPVADLLADPDPGPVATHEMVVDFGQVADRFLGRLVVADPGEVREEQFGEFPSGVLAQERFAGFLQAFEELPDQFVRMPGLFLPFGGLRLVPEPPVKKGGERSAYFSHVVPRG
jgi:hypothetical protein